MRLIVIMILMIVIAMEILNVMRCMFFFPLVANDCANDHHIEQLEIDKWWDFGVAIDVFDEFEDARSRSSCLSC